MRTDTVILETEREKCRKVVEAFAELYERTDVIALDAGKYGFVKLQYYNKDGSFDNVRTYSDSKALFDDLWEEWFNLYLLDVTEGTEVQDSSYEKMYEYLSKEKKEKLSAMRKCLAEKAKIEGDDVL